jgi:hypothetical protein
VRGKNIIWLSLIAALLLVSVINIGSTQLIDTKLKITPSRIPDASEGYGEPGESWTIAIEIEKVHDLWAAGWKIQIAPYASVLVASEVYEGDFLSQGGYETAFAYDIDVFHGIISIGVSRLVTGGLPTEGASGDGILATLKLTAVEAGSSPVNLVDTYLIDSVGGFIDHLIRDSAYVGTDASLIRVMLESRVRSVGQTQTFNTKVKNEGDQPLDIKVKIDNIRVSDGFKLTRWAGQSWNTAPPRASETYKVDGFTASYQEWTEVGTAPFLDDETDGNYITGTGDATWHAWFTFEDIDLSDGAKIKTIRLWGFTNGPSNDAVDYDVYSQNFAWLGSLYGAGSPQWVAPRWVGPDETVDVLEPSSKTEAGFNDFMVLMYGYGPASAADEVHALKLVVEFYPPLDPVDPPVYTVQGGEALELGDAVWLLRPDDIGQYMVSVSVYFTVVGGGSFYVGGKSTTRSWRCDP